MNENYMKIKKATIEKKSFNDLKIGDILFYDESPMKLVKKQVVKNYNLINIELQPNLLKDNFTLKFYCEIPFYKIIDCEFEKPFKNEQFNNPYCKAKDAYTPLIDFARNNENAELLNEYMNELIIFLSLHHNDTKNNTNKEIKELILKNMNCIAGHYPQKQHEMIMNYFYENFR